MTPNRCRCRHCCCCCNTRTKACKGMMRALRKGHFQATVFTPHPGKGPREAPFGIAIRLQQHGDVTGFSSEAVGFVCPASTKKERGSQPARQTVRFLCNPPADFNHSKGQRRPGDAGIPGPRLGPGARRVSARRAVWRRPRAASAAPARLLACSAMKPKVLTICLA